MLDLVVTHWVRLVSALIGGTAGLKAAEDARRAAEAKAAEEARRAAEAKAAEDARRAAKACALPDFGTADLRAFPNPPALPAFVSGDG